MSKMTYAEEFLIAADQLWGGNCFTWTQGRKLYGAIANHTPPPWYRQNRVQWHGGDMTYNSLLRGCVKTRRLVRYWKGTSTVAGRWRYMVTTTKGSGPFYDHRRRS